MLQYEKSQLLYYATLDHPTNKGKKVGLKLGLDACDASTPLGKLTSIGANASITAGGEA
jgi:hypothetical protein